VGKENSDVANELDVTTSIRDLIVQLHRGNRAPAESLVDEISGQLKGMMRTGADPQSSSMLRAQQTMFAIDEVRILITQRDYRAASEAARDAGKEWKQKPTAE